MVKDTVTVCITAFWVPVIVSGKVPVAAAADVDTLSVVVAVGFTGLAIEHVTPDGQPLTARFTVPVNPYKVVTVTLEVAPPPGPGG